MTVTATPIFAQTPVIGKATLTGPTPITSRANITGTIGLTQLTPVSTNGKRVDWFRTQSKGTSLAGLIFLWMYDGTTSSLIDEIVLPAGVTPSTTAAGMKADTYYPLPIALPPTYQLFVSVTVAQDLNVFAMGGDY